MAEPVLSVCRRIVIARHSVIIGRRIITDLEGHAVMLAFVRFVFGTLAFRGRSPPLGTPLCSFLRMLQHLSIILSRNGNSSPGASGAAQRAGSIKHEGEALTRQTRRRRRGRHRRGHRGPAAVHRPWAGCSTQVV